MSDVDLVVASTCAAWTVAIVAGIRARVPAIDGAWVLLVAAAVACLVAAVLGGPDWMPALRYAGLAWIGAVGGVSFIDRVVDR